MVEEEHVVQPVHQEGQSMVEDEHVVPLVRKSGRELSHPYG